MQIRNVTSWDECQKKLKELEEDRIKLRQETEPLYVSHLLYRGQANAEKWKLETTLERHANSNKISFYEYYKVISKIRPEIESFTGKIWNIPSLSDCANWLKSADFFSPAGYSWN